MARNSRLDDEAATELHNRLANQIVAQIVNEPIAAGGTISDVIMLCESVLVGVSWDASNSAARRRCSTWWSGGSKSISPRHCQLKKGWYTSSVGGAVARCGEVLWMPIGLTPSQPRGAGKLTSTPLS